MHMVLPMRTEELSARKLERRTLVTILDIIRAPVRNCLTMEKDEIELKADLYIPVSSVSMA